MDARAFRQVTVFGILSILFVGKQCGATDQAVAVGATNLRGGAAHEYGLRLVSPSQSGTPQVFGDGSREADAKAWPATFIFIDPGGTECTATAVSERTVLTAAHCPRTTSEGSFNLNGRLYSMKCTRHNDYPADKRADFALCLLAPELPTTPTGFEVISVAADVPTRSAAITLLGYGCRMQGGVDRGFGKLAQGDATVLSASEDELQTGGRATLCLGDSGGGAFFAADVGHLARRLVAVNSRSDLEEISMLSRTSSDQFLKWVKSWRTQNSQKICGLDADAKHCHQ
jgi:hypothetical protein